MTYALTAAPEIVNTWYTSSRSRDAYGRLTGGVNLSLASALTLQVRASGTVEEEGGNDLAGSLALRVGF
jgi:hypothetical protein